MSIKFNTLVAFSFLSLLLVHCSVPEPIQPPNQNPTPIPTATPVIGTDIIAGLPAYYADGVGNTARFRTPRAVASNGTSLFVCDGTNTIRRIDISTGEVTTFAGFAGCQGNEDGIATARFDNPFGIVVSGSDLYVTDFWKHTVRRIEISTGMVTTIAGTAGMSGSLDGTGADVRFNSPYGIASDGTNLYVSDMVNNTIRKIVIATAEVSTIAGVAGTSGSADGIGADARFYRPTAIVRNGNELFVADSYNQTIRKIDISTSTVSTVAGSAGTSGSADGIGIEARFAYPSGITCDGANLYVADSNNNTLRKVVISTGEVITVAGVAGTRGSADGTGSAALFNNLKGLCVQDGSLFVCDYSNYTVRKVELSGFIVSTFAGNAETTGYVEATGDAARFYTPWGIAHDSTSLYVADRDNNTIRQISVSTKQTSIVAGSAGSSGSSDGIGQSARFYSPYGLVCVGDYLYVCDENNSTIRSIYLPTKEVATFAGTVGVQGNSNGTGTNARFNTPWGIASDGTNLYVCDMGSSNIRKIEISSKVVTTFAGNAASQGSIDGVGTAARFLFPEGIACDGTYLYVCDTGNHTIRKIEIATQTVSTIAGSPTIAGTSDDIGNNARFRSPRGIAVNGSQLYVCDSINSRIRKVDISTGQVTTVSGGDGPGYQDGASLTQKMYTPFCICVLDNTLYFTQSHCIRRVY